MESRDSEKDDGGYWMMELSIIGIVLTCAGTVFSLWSIITKDTERSNTWLAVREKGQDDKKEKIEARWGIGLIILGSILQLIGVYQSQ